MKLTYDEAGDAHFILKTKAHEIDATVENSVLYFHGFEYRGCDHLFVRTRTDEDRTYGKYIWRVAVDEFFGEGTFEQLAEEMTSEGWESVCNEIPDEGDMEQFDNICKMLGEKITNKALKEWLA